MMHLKSIEWIYVYSKESNSIDWPSQLDAISSKKMAAAQDKTKIMYFWKKPLEISTAFLIM